MLFTGLVGIFLVFVDLTGSLPVDTKPRVSSDVAPGFSYYTQNNKVLFNNKIVPKLATAKVPSVSSRTRKAGNNPYRQTFFRLKPEKTVLDVVEPLVKPTDYQLKSVGDEKSTQLSTKKSDGVGKTTEPTPKKSGDDRKIIKPTLSKLEQKQTNEVSSNKEVDDGEQIILDQGSSKSKLCGNSSETSSSEEESSEESTTGNPLSQCNSSEEGSGDSLSEGSGNQSSEENTGENSSGSEEGTTEYYNSEGEKLGENYSGENAEETKDNKYKTDEKSASTGTTKAESSEENEGGVSESSGDGQEEKNSSEENLTTVNPSDEDATTDSNPSDEDTTIKNPSGGDATTESNPSDEDTTTDNPSEGVNYSTTEVSSSNENNYATTEVSSSKGNNYVTAEIESTPTTEQPVFGKKLTEQPATENIYTTTVKQLAKSAGNKIEQKTYNDDDPTIFYLGSKKLIPYYLRRSNPADNKSIQKTSTITSAGGTQQRVYSLTGKNRRNSIGKTPKITIGGTQQNYALTGRFPPRTG